MFKRTTIRYCSAALSLLMAFGSPLGLAQEMKAQKAKTGGSVKFTEEQKVNHMLNRITFGPRPGDVDRVMKMGWQKYLDEQLHPERISDEVIAQRLKGLESINLSGAEMAKYYPPPQVIKRILESKGLELPGQGLNQGKPNQTANDQTKTDATDDQMPVESPDAKKQANVPKFNVDDMRKRREAMQELAQMGYKRPQIAIQELQASKILRAVYSERQFQEVMTDFWFNHFNIFINKGADRILTTPYERDVIRPAVFGKFEDLLRATAESPAMLFYLDNWQSAAPNARMEQLRNGRFRNGRFGDKMQRQDGQNQMPNDNGKIQRRQRGINENYAREIMELHTLGVDGGYTQKDVQEVARCFTGWTLRNPRGGAEFVFNPFMHDDGEKTVLGHKIPAGGGKKDGETVIGILAHHPSTAKFISKKLAVKFVSDNPPQSLIDRMAQTFLKSDGDIREVLKTMFNSTEFWSPETYRSKIKTPFEMTTSSVRAIGADTNGGPAFHRWIAQMGEGLFLAQPPTGYPDTSEHWVNTGALLERMNFALALSSNRIQGTRVDLNNLTAMAGGSRASDIVDRYAKLLLRGDLSPQTRSTIDKTLNERTIDNSGGQDQEVAKIVGLILGSPEFQRQ